MRRLCMNQLKIHRNTSAWVVPAVSKHVQATRKYLEVPQLWPGCTTSASSNFRPCNSTAYLQCRHQAQRLEQSFLNGSFTLHDAQSPAPTQMPYICVPVIYHRSPISKRWKPLFNKWKAWLVMSNLAIASIVDMHAASG